MVRNFFSALVYVVVVVAAVAGVGMYVGVRAEKIQPIKPYVVLSGSMEPTVPVGSVVVVQPSSSSYGFGDIVTFTQSSSKDAVTHRINTIENHSGEVVYTTKGDANKTVDNTQVKKEQVVGKVIWTIPYLGYAIDYTKKPYGFLLLVIVPATIIIYEELKNVGKELKKATGKNNNGKILTDKMAEATNITSVKPATIQAEEQFERSLQWNVVVPQSFYQQINRYAPSLPLKFLGVSVSTPAPILQTEMVEEPKVVRLVEKPKQVRSMKWLGVVPTVAVIMLFVGVTGSFFVDAEVSLANILGASDEYEQTEVDFIADTLVINEVLPTSSCFQGQTEGVFVELYNGLPNTVDLKDYSITDGVNTVALVNAGSILVPKDTLVILTHSSAIFGNNKCFEEPGVQVANLGGQIDLNTELLQLLDENEMVVDTVKWGTTVGLEPAVNQSIERVPTGFDTALGSLFTASDLVVNGVSSPGL